ncbi:MAG: sigma-70 family RNA polymerase sigma factor [Clostridia bacterium]|nr:sigma-70 family RNA polymerase sigma factor [Clostridia bacterium]
MAKPDNLALLQKLSEGDESVLEELMLSNMGLVRSCASRFVGRGVEYEDLVQIGSIGLLRAARAFRLDLGCMFSTYAVPLIIGEIKRFLRDDGMVKVSRRLKSTGLQVMKTAEAFSKEYGREPTLFEIAERVGLTPEEVAEALAATGPVSSLNESAGEDDAPLEYFLADKENPLESITDRIALAEAIKSLPPRRSQIVYLRFFKELSQSETGKALGISQVKVSREEKIILQELRKVL